jgi:hypothetical protein
MKKTAVLAAITAAMVLTIAPAMAQDAPTSTGISLRVGAFFPNDAFAKAQSKTWFAVGVQYKVSELSQFSKDNYKADLAVSFDYYERSGFRISPLLLNYVGHIGEDFFYTGGVGVAFTRFPAGTGFNSETKFAYTVGVGYNVTKGKQPIFVEGKFFGNETKEYNGFGLYAGIRF